MASKTFNVSGLHGELIVDAGTGKVIYLLNYDSDEYEKITQFDVLGWERYHDTQIEGLTLDILDIGYWEVNEAGKEVFEEPCHNWRDELDAILVEEASYYDGM